MMNEYSADGGGAVKKQDFGLFGSQFGLQGFKEQVDELVKSSVQYAESNNVKYSPITGGYVDNNDKWVLWAIIGFVVVAILKIFFD